VGAPAAAGARDVTWDLRDDRGRTLEAGVYWLVVDAERSRQSKRVVVLP
jgi:hypothetical protein